MWNWAYSKITKGEVDDFYGISLGALSTIQQSAEALQTFGTNLADGKLNPKDAYNALRYTTQALGMPVHNLYLPVNSIIQYARDNANAEDRGMYDDLITEINDQVKADRKLREKYDGNVKAVKRAEDKGQAYSGWHTFEEAGIGYDDWLSIKDKHADLEAEEELSASQKADRFDVWLRNQGYDTEHKDFIAEEFSFFSQVRAETKKLDTLTALGMSPDNALKAKDSISAESARISEYNEQFPEGDERRLSYGGWQKLDTLTALGLNDKETDIAASQYLSENQAITYKAFRDSGIKPSAVYQNLDELNGDNDNISQAELRAFYRAHPELEDALRTIWEETKMWHESDGPKSTKSKKTWEQVRGSKVK